MKIENSVLLATPEQYNYLEEIYSKFVFHDPDNPSQIWDNRREYFAKKGYQSLWFKGIPLVIKRFGKYKYIDLRKLGNNLSAWREKIWFN